MIDPSRFPTLTAVVNRVERYILESVKSAHDPIPTKYTVSRAEHDNLRRDLVNWNRENGQPFVHCDRDGDPLICGVGVQAKAERC